MVRERVVEQEVQPLEIGGKGGSGIIPFVVFSFCCL